MQSSRDIETQAAEWLIRLDEEDSVEVRAELQKWLDSGPKNHAVFLRLEKSWRRADYLKNVKPLDGEVNENVLDTFPGALSPEAQKARQKRSRRALSLAIAASVLLAGVLGGGLWITLMHAEGQVFKTDLGGFQRIALQDGSTALLNTNSELHVHITKDRRQIELARGEALFTVSHDVDRPFDVKAGDTVVRAVGTAFSVRLGEQKQVDIIVTEGRVAINPPDGSPNKLLAQTVALPQLSTLRAGEEVRVKSHKLQVQKVDDEDISRKLSWTKGRLFFDHLTMEEAVAEFSQYNRRRLIIADPAIAQLRISGVFDATDLDSFVEALGTIGIRAEPAHDTTDDEVIRLIGDRK